MFKPRRTTKSAYQLLTDENETREESDEFRTLPFTRYMQEALTANPYLLKGDIFTYLDYVRHNVPRLLSEDEEQSADLPKCNVRAAKALNEANRLYQEKDYQKSLEKYNESICWARSDSEDLAFGYAHRSFIYYDTREYELALANIALAKKHNIPEQLMPKLLAQELNCKTLIEAGESRNSKPCPKLALNVEMNSRIPSVAKGISMEELPRFGRSMVAERYFKVGSVILSEKPTMVSIDLETKYLICQYCSSQNFLSLIPCPHCVSVMYCSDECLTNAWTETHRFECGICDKIASIPFVEYHMAPKMLFYGLTCFSDDVEEMMKYCKSHKRTGSNPFVLDYTKKDQLETFKVFHTAKKRPLENEQENVCRCITAILYTIYIRQPLIQSLFVTQAQKNFLLKYMFEYSTVVKSISIFWENSMSVYYSVASLCNHSCDPNTYAMYNSGQLKFVVIRPIFKDDQICISYGPISYKICDTERQKQLTRKDIDCACEVCDPYGYPKWQLSRNTDHPRFFHQHFARMQTMLANATLTQADKLDALQQFIQRYACIHPQDPLPKVLTTYMNELSLAFDLEITAAMRKKAYAGMN